MDGLIATAVPRPSLAPVSEPSATRRRRQLVTVQRLLATAGDRVKAHEAPRRGHFSSKMRRSFATGVKALTVRITDLEGE
jgi:hypothetical protein